MSSERPDGVVVVGGEALFDLVLDDDGELRAHAGGGPFATARALGRLARPVAYLGRLSRDRLGAMLARLLADDGVALDTAVRTDDPTTLALAEIDAEGSARYRFYAYGTSVRRRPSSACRRTSRCSTSAASAWPRSPSPRPSRRWSRRWPATLSWRSTRTSARR